MQAYERSGRILNITVTPADANDPPRLLNYLTSPHALVWSAVAASSAFPGLFPAQHLLARNSLGMLSSHNQCLDQSINPPTNK
jgi:TAG lipase/steryl ester hydrolase/phospholipase A2/LPA acyltransferase